MTLTNIMLVAHIIPAVAFAIAAYVGPLYHFER